MTRVYPEFPSNCFISSDYSGEQEAANKYLGIDNTITVNPTVKLTASFEDTFGIESFFTWWHDEVNDGPNIFLVVTTLLGKSSTYGLKAISSVVHKENDDGTQKITFSAELLFDSDTVDNEVPTGTDLEVNVEQDSSDNFIVVKGLDVENDLLDYDVVTEPEFGFLTGTAPNLLYTPDESYTGEDSFTFTVSDVFNTSEEATVTITVGEIEVAISEFEYVTTGEMLVNGNYHYSFLQDVIKRGEGSYLTPPAIFDEGTFLSRSSTATYVDDDVLVYAVVDEERKQDGVPLLEQESENEFIRSSLFTDASWSKSGSLTATSDATLAPDGIATSFRVSTTTTALSELSQSFASDGKQRVTSFWVKSNGAGNDEFNLVNGTSSTSHTATAEWVRYSLNAYTDGTITGLSNNGDLMDILVCFAQTEADSIVIRSCLKEFFFYRFTNIRSKFRSLSNCISIVDPFVNMP